MRMSDERLASMGCTNHGCVIFDGGGMRTNGLCRCVRNLPEHQLHRAFKLKNSRIKELETEVERLRKIIGEYSLELPKATQRAEAAEALLDESREHLQAWLDADECDCEDGHVCGRPRVQRTVDAITKVTGEQT